MANTDRLDSAIERLRSSPPLSTQPSTASPRRLLGWPVNAFKRAVTRLLAWYSAWLTGELQAFAATVATALEDLRDSRAETRQKLTRIERRLAGNHAPLKPATVAVEASGAQGPSARHLSLQVEKTLDYVEFENRFRGTPAEIRRRQSAYAELFLGAPGPTVDLGCGRGEFLSVLAEAGVDCYGVDQNPNMVAFCTEHGLKAVHGDAIGYLAGLERESLGGIFSAQMVEHLEPDEVVRLFELAAECLAESGVLAIETLNPQSLATFTNALYVDLGHLRPLHPTTLTFLAERAGFRQVEIRYSSPVAPEARLNMVPKGSLQDGALEALLNANFQRIDDVLFGPQDFAVVARR